MLPDYQALFIGDEIKKSDFIKINAFRRHYINRCLFIKGLLLLGYS